MNLGGKFFWKQPKSKPTFTEYSLSFSRSNIQLSSTDSPALVGVGTSSITIRRQLQYSIIVNAAEGWRASELVPAACEQQTESV